MAARPDDLDIAKTLSAEASPLREAQATLPRPTLVPADEQLLIDAAIGGDTDAFAALYDLYAGRVYRHCYYIVANRAEAEDLMQVTFLRAWQAIGRFRHGYAPFIAWLLTIAERVAIDQLRSRREVAAIESVADPVDLESDPARLVAADLARDRLRQAILKLQPIRRQVIILRFIEGFSVAEVAGALGKSENNVSVIQHRALADLRHILLLNDRPAGTDTPGQSLGSVITSVVRRLRTSTRDS